MEIKKRVMTEDERNENDQLKKTIKAVKIQPKEPEIKVIKYEITPEIENIQKSETFFEDIIKKLDEILVGEAASKRVLTLTSFGGRLVKNANRASFAVLVNDESGVGKGFVCRKILRILPQDIFISRTRISQRVLDYWDTDWTGKILLLDDVEEEVLNSSTFKTFMSDDNETSLVHMGKAIHRKIIGKPIIILTTAESIPIAENMRRIISVKLDATKEQTERIAQYQLNETLGESKIFDINFTKALSLLNIVEVKFTQEIVDNIKNIYSPEDVSDRTQHQRFIDFIKASAALNQKNREKEGEIIIANENDLKLAIEIFKIIAPAEIKHKTLTTAQQKIIRFFLLTPNFEGNKLNILNRLQSTTNRLSLQAVYLNVDKLRDMGYLDVFEKEVNGRLFETFKLAPRWIKDTTGLQAWLS